jgi:hypothetical protein
VGVKDNVAIAFILLMFVLILLELTTVTFKVLIVEFSLQSNSYMDILSSVSFSSTLLTFFFFSVQEVGL